MKLITAPEPLPTTMLEKSVFLGGGISNCPDWQSEIITLLGDTDLTLLTPRREGVLQKSWEQEQITWEYKALRIAETVMFWFPSETLCPITLFELGVFTQRLDTRLIVGTDPAYQRRSDVLIQLQLARPEVEVVDSIWELSQQALIRH